MRTTPTFKTLGSSRGWEVEVSLILLAFAGTACYGWSFFAAGFGAQVAETARSIGWAAGVSWVVFGGVLAVMDRSAGGILNWFRLCLRTMGVGMGVLSYSMIANWAVGESTSWRLLAFHLIVLIGSDGLMCWVFVRGAKRLGVRTAAAIGHWVILLNGLFAVLLAWMVWR